MGRSKGGSVDIQRYSPLLFELQSHLIRIKTLADTSTKSSIRRSQMVGIERISKHALAVLDYALFAIESRQTALPLSAVSAVAAAEDVMQELWQLARSYDVKLELEATKRLGPVYANEAALRGALHGLTHSAITAQTTQAKRKIIISVQGTQPGQQRLGVLAPGLHFSSASVTRARELATKARVSAPNELYGGGLGLLVSDELTRALDSKLTDIRRHGQRGVGFYISTSNQLSLV